jgi:parallel beta-helix repeat protein
LDGLRFSGSSNNVIVDNSIIENKGKGANLIDSSDNNSFYENVFIGNGNNTLNPFIRENAYDECNNQWDNGQKGNFWDDYTGRGLRPYLIPPPPWNNRDMHPITYGELDPVWLAILVFLSLTTYSRSDGSLLLTTLVFLSLASFLPLN